MTITKEKSIIFSPAMAQAVSDGRKTQTRRIIIPKPVQRAHGFPMGDDDWAFAIGGGCFRVTNHPHDNPDILRIAKYQPGDVCYVRESIYVDYNDFDYSNPPKDMDMLYYRGDGECCEQIPECCCAEVGKPRWRPSIHMPKWAARSFIEIVSVRCERVQDISESDAKAEGVGLAMFSSDVPGRVAPLLSSECYRAGFAILWGQINGRGAWNRNDWVWVYEFKKVHKR